ncbi:MAG: ABC transporter permease [bacterium]|jgi:putative spermidine/putrescine transport system permease protein|nr:ABC transporter permease [SAR324 cluster bacterium]
MKNNHLLILSLSLVYLFLIGPLVIIVFSAFNDSEFLDFPPQTYSLRWFYRIFESEMFISAFQNSLLLSFFGALGALLIGLPAAYSLSRTNSKWRQPALSLFLSPVIIPGVVLGFAVLKHIVIPLEIETWTGLAIAHALIMLPYIIRVIVSSLSNVPVEIEEAAVSLGSTRMHAFLVVVLPNIQSGILAACLLAFITSLNDVPVTIFLTGPGVTTLPIQMLSYVEYYFDPTVSAISVLLMFLTIILMFLIEATMGLSFFTKK